MDFESFEQIVVELVAGSGEGRSKAMEAIAKAKQGDFESAVELIESAEESLSKAHSVQTGLIQKEARGEHARMSLLMVHAQDHIMNAMTVRDMALEMIDLYKMIYGKLGVKND